MDDTDIVLNGKPLKDVESFQYLGSVMSKLSDIDMEISSRIW